MDENARMRWRLLPPVCDEHPPLGDWPRDNLISGHCPACGMTLDNAKDAARVLRERDAAAREPVKLRGAQR